MSEELVKHQNFEYQENEPFQIYNVYADTQVSNMLLAHWHSELEVVYLMGCSKHYIDGKCIQGKPGDFIVTNSESVHKIEPEKTDMYTDQIVAIVLLIHETFLERNFPDFRKIQFTNDQIQAEPDIARIMLKMSAYVTRPKTEAYDYLCVKGMILELLYQMTRRGIVNRSSIAKINADKNIERLKGVLQFVENHYMEEITEAGIAEKFYFSPVYFSRYFKKCTGMTFVSYLTEYRLSKAKQDLLYTEKSIIEIALKNGFSDSRRLSIAFNKIYGCTPRQYKKDAKMKKI
ncbi:MAG: helix-turn-helix transcriptional regulator [Butyrivibrio sp.]|nr:helix-turn-helix transcriptional regulator [Butyrivibrio sp.]